MQTSYKMLGRFFRSLKTCYLKARILSYRDCGYNKLWLINFGNSRIDIIANKGRQNQVSNSCTAIITIFIIVLL